MPAVSRRLLLRHTQPSSVHHKVPNYTARILSSSWFSSSSAVARNATKTDKNKQRPSHNEEHDLRVAAAQAQILARIRGQKGLAVQQEAQKKLDVQNAELNVMMQTLHHWLLKDVKFFVATMEALDISLLEDGGQKHSTTSNNNQNNNNNRGGGRSRGAKSKAATKDSSESFLNGHHPMQMVLDQYRQLYFDSIPEFEEHLKRNDNDFLIQNSVLKQLKDVGFADAQWSRRFRQVRGYQLQQDGLMRNLAKQQVELQRRKQVVKAAKQELKELESMERLLSNAGGNMTYGRGNKRRRRRRQKAEPTTQTLEQTPTNATEEPQQLSFLQQAWNTVSSMWGAEPATAANETKVVSTVPPAKETPRVEEKKQESETLSKDSKPTRIQKRVMRKQASLCGLEEQVEEAASKLLSVEQQIKSLDVPIDPNEYERAQGTVAKVRDTVCAEFAKFMQDRHAHLIAQYESLNSKTDLTKPQEWVSVATCIACLELLSPL